MTVRVVLRLPTAEGLELLRQEFGAAVDRHLKFELHAGRGRYFSARRRQALLVAARRVLRDRNADSRARAAARAFVRKHGGANAID